LKPQTIDYSLLLVTDHCEDVAVFCRTIESAVRSGVSMVQLREKTAGSRDFYQLALQVQQITQRYKLPLIINDRLDIALAVDADGVHVGQEDLPVAVVRRLLGPDRIIGATAPTVATALRAEADGADYIGSGAVFPTLTKPGKQVLPLAVLTQIKQAVRVPVVAIGGITADNLLALKNIGVDGIAVVSAIMNSDDPAAATQEILSLWRK
jgi:thiamine-phosphate pyrophosphorylase